MSGTKSNEFQYEIDRDDRMVRMSDNWDDFALSNGGRNICTGDLLARPLMDYIAGDECRMIWRLLLAKVRKTRVPIALPYRCDGPSTRRFMEMTIRPLEREGIGFCSSIILEEKRPAVALLDAAAPRGEDRLLMCSWCNRGKSGNQWMEVDDLVRRENLFVHGTVPLMTHGMCEDCALRFESPAG